ncbi:electron transfer flavoprotein subunit alpha/FixB family protein [Pseudosulfitobacter sp. DSM 107133]|uniref:electron transfer flavoprotein subunit alpha/FixB family protein n=1 Tax=Pseudosulfitobacter sp. DSM 107133 TaxID=2883100 RepID=UPI000DF266E2|nr:electron transfer flavoprotein subunit alpha/FixB family protein [Pseudosulfitobacter sp. DSM 107133]UOA29230.1 Electron transfer flavoprotein subunit alpha [Pseudosulfitobacter sp. DSM 107133]
MAILVFAEHDNASLSEQSAKALTAALQIGSDVDILVAGKNADAAIAQAAQLGGVRSVIVADADALEHRLAEATADLIVALSVDYDTILAPATATGKNVLPRVAALLDVAQISEITEVVSPDTFKRPIYAGNAIEVVQSTEAKRVLTVRTAGFSAASAADAAAPVKHVETPNASDLSRFIANTLSDSDRPNLSSAKIIVSGGRALGSQDRFQKVLSPLADKLGAAVGASRAAVDAGYAANDLQIGQTGKVVAPDLYIACGISGAIQHLAGMKDSKVIVAINTDEEAPIFQVSDYGMVADIFDVLPELVRQL